MSFEKTRPWENICNWCLNPIDASRKAKDSSDDKVCAVTKDLSPGSGRGNNEGPKVQYSLQACVPTDPFPSARPSLTPTLRHLPTMLASLEQSWGYFLY